MISDYYLQKNSPKKTNSEIILDSFNGKIFDYITNQIILLTEIGLETAQAASIAKIMNEEYPLINGSYYDTSSANLSKLEEYCDDKYALPEQCIKLTYDKPILLKEYINNLNENLSKIKLVSNEELNEMRKELDEIVEKIENNEFNSDEYYTEGDVSQLLYRKTLPIEYIIKPSFTTPI